MNQAFQPLLQELSDRIQFRTEEYQQLVERQQDLPSDHPMQTMFLALMNPPRLVRENLEWVKAEIEAILAAEAPPKLTLSGDGFTRVDSNQEPSTGLYS